MYTRVRVRLVYQVHDPMVHGFTPYSMRKNLWTIIWVMAMIPSTLLAFMAEGHLRRECYNETSVVDD
ncbi:hypothetical protein BS17DRAFT_777063 [Gyrodon lividus]|nr:hypothetical protein BS17DRAFT_777063 [Gyrodon lividus]